MTAVHTVLVAKPATPATVQEEMLWLPGAAGDWAQDEPETFPAFYSRMLSTGQRAEIWYYDETPPEHPASIVADGPFEGSTAWEYVYAAYPNDPVAFIWPQGTYEPGTMATFGRYGFGLWITSIGEDEATATSLITIGAMDPAHYVQLLSWSTEYDTGETFEYPEFPGVPQPVLRTSWYHLMTREGDLTLVIGHRELPGEVTWSEELVLADASAMLAAGWCYVTASFIPGASTLTVYVYEDDGTPHATVVAVPTVAADAAQTLGTVYFGNSSDAEWTAADKPKRFSEFHWLSGTAYPTARPTASLVP